MSAKQEELVCQRVVELVNEYIGHRLTSAEREAFDAHLATCPPCTTYLAQIRAVVGVAGSLSSEQVAESVEPELLAMFAEWREKNGA